MHLLSSEFMLKHTLASAYPPDWVIIIDHIVHFYFSTQDCSSLTTV